MLTRHTFEVVMRSGMCPGRKQEKVQGNRPQPQARNATRHHPGKAADQTQGKRVAAFFVMTPIFSQVALPLSAAP